MTRNSVRIAALVCAALESSGAEALAVPTARSDAPDVEIRIPVLDERGPVRAKDLQWCGVLSEPFEPCLDLERPFGPTPPSESAAWGGPWQTESIVVGRYHGLQATSGSGEEPGITLRLSQREDGVSGGLRQGARAVRLELWVRTRPSYDGPTRMAHREWSGMLESRNELPTLQLEVPPLLASGTLLDLAGKPLPWTRIELDDGEGAGGLLDPPPSPRGRELAWAESSADGSFEIRGLDPAPSASVVEPEVRLRVRAAPTMPEFPRVRVAHGATDLVIRARERGRLVQLQDAFEIAGADAWLRLQVGLRAQDTKDPRLSFPVTLDPWGGAWSAVVPSGRYDLVAELADGQRLVRSGVLEVPGVPSEPEPSDAEVPLDVRLDEPFVLHRFEPHAMGAEGELPCARVRRAWHPEVPLTLHSSVSPVSGFLHVQPEAEVELEADGYQSRRITLRPGRSEITLAPLAK